MALAVRSQLISDCNPHLVVEAKQNDALAAALRNVLVLALLSARLRIISKSRDVIEM